MRRNALVALSGGVDSSVALNLALERYDAVRAVHLNTSGGEIPEEVYRVASSAGVPLTVIDAAAEFGREIRQWSSGMLSRGLTPNPCARCNALIKLLLPFRMLEHREELLTGHYARMEDGDLRRGADPSKDQSYFLSLVDREILVRCRFLLGGMRKENVISLAEERGIPCRKRESMDLCFSMEAAGDPGSIVDTEGNVLGEHGGIEGFTVGQRKGLGALGKRMYVLAIDPIGGRVTVGSRDELMCRACSLENVNWIRTPDSFPIHVLAQTRYRRRAVRALLDTEGQRVHIGFHGCEEAVAPGQVCAIYLDDIVLGGGIMISAEKA
jgi:tRNA-specific 2-thiouridylase